MTAYANAISRAISRPPRTLTEGEQRLLLKISGQRMELQRRPPEVVPANLVPDVPPVWSGKLLPCCEAVHRFAFTRAFQVRHTNALEYDFLFGLAAYLEQRDSLVLVGSGPRGVGPLIPERNAAPMKGLLAGRTRGDAYRLVLYLASFELRAPEVAA